MKKIFALLALLMFMSGMGYSQCKGFVKKKCVPQLKPYVNNGKGSSAIMRPGDKAELMMTFNSGVDYRLLIANMDNIKLSFKVMDSDRNVFFDSGKQNKNYFDFNVAATQQLIVEIVCEDSESLTGITPEGCVAILTGYKLK